MIAARVSVVVVDYKSADATAQLLDSLRASTLTPAEVIVVDNDPAGNGTERLRARGDVVVLASERNLGFGGGCNLGARRAGGDLLVFANPDVLLEPDTLEVLARDLLEAPGVVVSFPAMEHPGDPPHERARKLEEVATMAGALMMVERAHFEALGGFDERIFLYYEDTELCWRTWLAGGRVVKDWSAVVRHGGHGSGGGDAWGAEQVKNGLHAYLKLRRWPSVIRFALLMVAKTLVRGAPRRDPAYVRAWTDNLRRLPETLAERRALRAGIPPERIADLERLCRSHADLQRRARRQAVTGGLRRRLGRGRPTATADRS